MTSRDCASRVSFCLASRRAAPRTNSVRVSQSVPNTANTAIHTVREVCATLASRTSRLRCTWTTPTGLPRAVVSRPRRRRCARSRPVAPVETSRTSAEGPERSTALACLRALTCRGPSIVEKTGLPFGDQIATPVNSSGVRIVRRSLASARRSPTMWSPRTSVGASTEFAYSATSRPRLSSTCSRKLSASTDERMSVPAARITADARTSAEQAQGPDETGRAVRT